MAEENNQENTNANEARRVADIHKYADTDSSTDALHHTLGSSPLQAAPGDHNHNGSNSMYLFDGIKITGSRKDGVALAALLDALVPLGLINESSL